MTDNDSKPFFGSLQHIPTLANDIVYTVSTFTLHSKRRQCRTTGVSSHHLVHEQPSYSYLREAVSVGRRTRERRAADRIVAGDGHGLWTNGGGIVTAQAQSNGDVFLGRLWSAEV